MREVTVFVVDPPVVLPTFAVETPWWMEVASIVDELRRRFGLDAIVLRLVAGDQVHRSPVTYLVEVVDGDAARWAIGATPEVPADPLRLPYAKPGGPQADLEWASAFVEMTGPPTQIRTWNLSSIWRLETSDGPVWLKHVPPFFAHEAAMLSLLNGLDLPVPQLIAHDRGRMLLAHVDGVDAHDPDLADEHRMVDLLPRFQQGVPIDAVLATGASDWRHGPFIEAIDSLIEGDAPEGHRYTLQSLQQQLPERFAALDRCGLAPTLVHGDFHPGNVRRTSDALVLLDWGDSGVGHPLLDLTAFCQRTTHPEIMRRYWLDQCLRQDPKADVERAARLIEPIAALRMALVYRMFLDNIEASERPYHRDDPADWLTIAARALAANPSLD